MNKNQYRECALSVSNIQMKRKKGTLYFRFFVGGRKDNLPRKIFLTEASLTNASKACAKSQVCSLEKNTLKGAGKIAAEIGFPTENLFRITSGTVLQIVIMDSLARTRNTLWFERSSDGEDWNCIDVKVEDAAEDTVFANVPDMSLDEIREASLGTSFVSDLCTQLEEEIEVLKKDGDKKYPFTNAVKISESRGMYLYSLEMETNQEFQESQRVEIRFKNKDVSSEVISVSDDEITILTEEDLGESIAAGFIVLNNWMLLQAQIDRLHKYARFDQKNLIKMLMEKGPQYGHDEDISKIKKGQAKAVSYASDHPITMIWGPPGTGKTFVLSQMAIKFAKEGKSVLIVSHSNVSVDGVTLKILELLRQNKQTKYIRDGKVIRYGYVRNKDLDKEKYSTALNYALSENPSILEDKARLEERRRQILSEGEKVEGERVLVENKLRELRGLIKKAQIDAIHNADIVTTTISKATVDSAILKQKYDVVMFDEASMAYVSQIYVAITLACDRFICVGDFRQLPPIIKSEGNKLRQDIFEYLGITDQEGNLFNHPWLVLLDKQRRMHPDIAAFSNKYIYASLLKNDSAISKERARSAGKGPFPGSALGYVNLAGSYGPAFKNDNNSRYNIVSAIVSVKLALYTAKETEDEVGIITPYAEQVRLIRLLLKEYFKINKYQKLKITCATVHQFQGMEKRTIIFDMVENYPSSRLGYMYAKNENDVLRLINVAVTRSKSKFIVVANDDFWDSKIRTADKNLIIRNFFTYMRHNAAQMNYKDVVELTGKDEIISLYQAEDAFSRIFARDIRTASETVDVFFPDSAIQDSGKKIMNPRIQDCISKGIRLRILAPEHCILPDSWSSYRFNISGDILPLIRIDKDTIWYGLPQSNVCYRVGNRIIATRIPVIARIASKSIVKEISALQNLERELALSCANMERESIQQEEKTLTLAEFVENRYICPDCGARLKCRIGRFPSMECKVCHHKQRLDPELVDAFLNEQHIRCPIHGCKLKAKIQRAGMMYILCDSENERHSFSLDDF